MSAPDNSELWNSYTRAFDAATKARNVFIHNTDTARISGIIRAALLTQQLEAAVEMIPWLDKAIVKSLVADLLPFARANSRFMNPVHAIILSLPADWLMEHIEKLAEPVLQTGQGDEFHGILYLYSKIDPELTQRLARRAAASEDYDIREVGEVYLDK